MINDNIRRINKLGISNFETADHVGRRQADLLDRMQSNAWFSRRRGQLQHCTADRCGGDKCAEVCAFGDWRRRLHQIPAAHRLISKTEGPLYEVIVIRGIWGHPIGELWRASIAAAKQLNRRALDTLFIPSLVAVGTFKVSLASDHWICVVHEIVAGADKEELEKAFVGNWPQEKYASIVRVKEIKDLGQTLDSVFSVDLKVWEHPDDIYIPPFKLKKHHREEFYRWLFGLSLGERMIRYGCDRYLNRLKKGTRTINAKVRKRRRYPIWLIPHMFGNRKQPLRGFPKGYRG